MRLYREETERLSDADDAVRKRFPRFGVNKRREATRLLYEISRREGIPPSGIIAAIPSCSFKTARELLLRKRFPHAHRHHELSTAFLPKLSLDPAAHPAPGVMRFRPSRVIIEEGAASSHLAAQVRAAFTEAQFSVIPDMKQQLRCAPPASPAEYNRRCETLFIAHEQHDFFKRCPCTKGAVPCGYHVFNLGFGCIYDCTYCYLQEYTNTPGIVLPANIGDFFGRFAGYARYRRRGSRMRIGTGEFADSLMLDHVTDYSPQIVEFMKTRTDVLFEFKTKSSNIGNLLASSHAGNIVIGWSLNPARIVNRDERATAPLADRLRAASRAAEAGYRVAFHFDPVLHFKGWESEYRDLIASVFDAVTDTAIAWMSIGTLRFRPALKPVIENRFPGSDILDEELLPGFDRKLRYPRSLRFAMYERMIAAVRKHSTKAPLYLCMEEQSLWEELRLPFPF